MLLLAFAALNVQVEASGDVGNCTEIEDEAQRTACFTVWYQARQEQAEREREIDADMRRIEERHERYMKCLADALEIGASARSLGCRR